jgi:RHS repeat-associated protein
MNQNLLHPAPVLRVFSPFGVVLEGRSWSVGSGYRYGFQAQEQDAELWEGAVNYKYRVEDPRLGRFFSVDPLNAKYPSNSNYAFSENSVIAFVELEGLEKGLNRLAPQFDVPPQGAQKEDWFYIDENTYFNQNNSARTKPGNFFYSTEMGKLHGCERMYYRQVTTLTNTPTSSSTTSTTMGTPTTATNTVTPNAIGFINWSPTLSNPAQANATFRQIANLAPNSSNTTTTTNSATSAPSISSSTVGRTRIRTTTTTTVTTTVVTTTNIVSQIFITYRTAGAAIGIGPGGVNAAALDRSRMNTVIGGITANGVAPSNITANPIQFNVPALNMGGLPNQFSFRIVTSTTTTTGTTTTINTNTTTRTTLKTYTD